MLYKIVVRCKSIQIVIRIASKFAFFSRNIGPIHELEAIS